MSDPRETPFSISRDNVEGLAAWKSRLQSAGPAERRAMRAAIVKAARDQTFLSATVPATVRRRRVFDSLIVGAALSRALLWDDLERADDLAAGALIPALDARFTPPPRR